MKQFADGEKSTILKDTFSIRSSEIDQARAMLESMAKDLAASVRGRGMIKQPANQQQQGTPQTQSAQLTHQPQQPQGAQQPPKAENMRRNSSKGGKSEQTPVAPTSAQPPFPFGASSPHGNPNYIGKPKEMTLQIPPARKKQKVKGDTPKGVTPSPQMSKKQSPEMRRASEPQVIICKEPECEMSLVGFHNEQDLQQHIQEEHTKPREDPLRFVQENLALALGLEPDGTTKKEASTDSSTVMSVTGSKQGQTQANPSGNTPISTDGAMNRSVSNMGKPQSGKAGVKMGGTPKPVDVKVVEAAVPTMDPWTNSTIDPQTLLNNLGLEKGFNSMFADLSQYRSGTPNDTPESAKDSGASEPNSDVSEGVNLEIDFDWQTMDTDLLLNMGNASIDSIDGSLDPEPNYMFEKHEAPIDWDEVNPDFSKPFQFDTSQYSMMTS